MIIRQAWGILASPAIVAAIFGCQQSNSGSAAQPVNGPDESSNHPVSTIEGHAKEKAESGISMKIQYLELVTPDVEAVCAQYSKVHGLTFSEPDTHLGGARTAPLSDGGRIGIRGPLRANETPVVRPYVLVEDIAAAVKSAADAGGVVALPPMSLGPHGQCAIVLHGGIECGLWQL